MTSDYRWADLETLAVGETAACDLVIDEPCIEAFARLSLDTNPLHTDAAVAEQYGFSRPVAHGMLALSAISRLIGTKLPGQGALWVSQDVRFVAPVLAGDRITAQVTVQQVSEATGMVTLKTEAFKSPGGASVLLGTAKVKVLRRRQPMDNSATDNRAAIVTGSSRGLGRAIALNLAASRIKVAVHYNRSADEAAAVVEAIRQNGGTAVACQADVTQPDGAERLFTQAHDAFGHIDILVNNATPPITPKPALELEWGDLQCYLTAYVRASLRMTQLAAPGMQARKFGRIVNVLCASAMGVPPPRLAAYVTAKSALAGLSRALAVELGPLGITVNMIAPSMLVTDQTVGVGERARQLAAAQSPLRRVAAMEEVASATGFLAGDGASFITGTVLPVAGGAAMP